MPSTVETRRATLADAGLVAPLFDAYRQFYGQPADAALAATFIRDRLNNNESVIFIAFDGNAAVGFTQLYRSFSSVSARPIWILNDLFVSPAARRTGVGRVLLEAARNHGLATGARRIVLSTATTNTGAQALYESFGYKLDEQFLVYELDL